MGRELEIIEFVFVIMIAVLGIIDIVFFVMTWMWHCLFIAAGCAALVWAWYYEGFKSKNRKISALWQAKSTKN
ncbi:MAG: hypothetical protein MR037_02585 [Bacteroidales bacterium]|nr:hypothetical protein [Bacteroidales bacterium]